MVYTQKKLFAELRKLKPMLYEKYGIKRIGVFGSYAIGAQDKNSDVDLIVELTRPLGWDYFGLPSFFEEKLHVKVDVGTVETLKPRIKEGILKQLIYID